jgi:hypothetical protein
MPLAFPPHHMGKIMYFHEASRFVTIPPVLSIPIASMVFTGIQTLSEKSYTPNPSSQKNGNNQPAPILTWSGNTSSPGKMHLSLPRKNLLQKSFSLKTRTRDLVLMFKFFN